MTLQEAIAARHSVRQYTGQPIAATTADALRQAIAAANAEGGLHMQLVTNEPKAFEGGMAKYGKFSGVNDYIAMVGPRDAEEAIGYYGERVVLVAQTLGLNTCWVGLTFRKQAERYTVAEAEKLHCVITVGYGATQGAQHPMREVSHFVHQPIGSLPDWFRRGVEAAMLAPTAVNQQKFGFALEGERTVRATARFSMVGYTKIDLGIAKQHFEVAAGRDNFQWA